MNGTKSALNISQISCALLTPSRYLLFSQSREQDHANGQVAELVGDLEESEVAEVKIIRDKSVGKLKESKVKQKQKTHSQQPGAAKDDAIVGNLGEVIQIHDTQSQTPDIPSEEKSVQSISSTERSSSDPGFVRHDSHAAIQFLFTHPSMSSKQNYQTFITSLSTQQPSNDVILQFLQPYAKRHVVLTVLNDSFQKSDFERISQRKWVTDQVVNGFLNNFIKPRETYLVQLPRLRRRQKWETANSSLIAELLQYRSPKEGTYNKDTARKHLKRTDFNEVKGILLPWHLHDNHWALIVVNFENETMSLLDSFWNKDRSEPTKVMEAIERYIEDRRKWYPNYSRPPITEWEHTFNRGNIPQQPNTLDCGIYTCFFADYITLEFKFDGRDRTIGATYRRFIMFQLGMFLQLGNQ